MTSKHKLFTTSIALSCLILSNSTPAFSSAFTPTNVEEQKGAKILTAAERRAQTAKRKAEATERMARTAEKREFTTVTTTLDVEEKEDGGDLNTTIIVTPQNRRNKATQFLENIRIQKEEDERKIRDIKEKVIVPPNQRTLQLEEERRKIEAEDKIFAERQQELAAAKAAMEAQIQANNERIQREQEQRAAIALQKAARESNQQSANDKYDRYKR